MLIIHWWSSVSSIITLVVGTWSHPTTVDAQDWGPWGMHMMWGSWGIGMMLMMFLFWAAVIVAIVFFVRWLLTTGNPGRQTAEERPTESALDILKKRYARGEISKQEFEEMRRDIQ